MKNLRIFALLLLVISLVLCGFTSCETLEGVADKVPGLEKVLDKLPGSHDHVFSDATCTAPKTCSCGATEGEALGHTYVDGKCACGASDPNYVPHTHSYTTEVTAPTCTADGYTTYTCSCGDTYTADKVSAPGHSFSNATCTTPKTCQTCNATEGEALGHAFVDGKCHCGADYVAPGAEWLLATELKDGDLVIIGAPAYGKLLSAEKVSAESYYNKGVNYSADDFSGVTDAEIFRVTVNDDGTYTFTSLTGDVLALAASYSSLNKDGEHKSWALTDRGDGTFLLKNTGRNLYLEWYDSKGNWSTYSAGNTKEYYLSFYVKNENYVAGAEHVHNHITETTAPTCTEDGYVTYTCECGDTYTMPGATATGHKFADATCTLPKTCSCGATEGEALGHTFVDGSCHCGEPDPDAHVHSYTAVVTAPTCTVAGYTTHTCTCGDSYTDSPVEVVPHVDANLDITCDFDGCSKRILPAADSKVSLFTANHMIIVSLSSNYYVEGVITEITDTKNGIFVIEDENGDSILVRLPKNAEGASYASWTDVKVVVGDTVQIYGKPTKNTSTPATEAAKIESGVLTIIKHEHNFSVATCSEASTCPCLALNAPALGHADEDANGLCDRCDWNMNLVSSHIVIATDTTLANGVFSDDQTNWKWSNDAFTVEISKGASTYTLYKTAKAYMQLKKQNDFTIYNTTGATVKSVTIYTTNATQLGYLKAAIGSAFTFTENADNFSVTIEFNSTENFYFQNAGSSTVYISGVDIVYEPATVTE